MINKAQKRDRNEIRQGSEKKKNKSCNRKQEERKAKITNQRPFSVPKIPKKYLKT